jgi:hypothetical protein
VINLLPTEQKLAYRYAKLNKTLVQFCSSLLGVGLLISSVIGYQYLASARSLNETKKELDIKSAAHNNDKTQAKAQELSKTISTAATLLSKEKKFSLIIKQIGAVMPSGTYLSGLNLINDTKQLLQIDAVLVDEAQALVLKENIVTIKDEKGRKVFVGADIQSITASTVRIGDAEVKRFNTRITTAFSDQKAGSAR